MKKVIFLLFGVAVLFACRNEPGLLFEYYGLEKISVEEETNAGRPEFRRGGEKIYYFAKTAADSLFQLRVVGPDGSRKILTSLAYNREKLPMLSEDENLLIYEKARRDTNSYLPYHLRLRKYYPDSVLKRAAHSPKKLVDLYRYDLSTGEEVRLTKSGNAHLFGFYEREAVLYYALEDSIFYLAPVSLAPVRRVSRYFSLSLSGLNREEVELLKSVYHSPSRKHSLVTQVVSDYQDKDFNRFRYYLVQPESDRHLLVWTGGNAAYRQGEPPQVEWLDDRRFLTTVVKTKAYIEEGHSADLRLLFSSGPVSVVHKGEVWEVDVSRGKAKKLCPVNPDFNFVLSGDRRYLFSVYRERQWEVVARINTVTRKFEEIGRIEHGRIADLAPNLDGTRLLFTLQDEKGRGTVYLAELKKPKWKKD